jgi:CubicO group peptidase (beta-lactamase class C family)
VSAEQALLGFAERIVADGRSAGVSIAVTSADRTLLRSGAGVTLGGAAFDADSLALIGSITKSATALLVLQERERGTLDLEAPVERYLPWFAVRNPHGPISLRHLLMHTAGLPLEVNPGPPSAANVALLAEVEPVWAPGLRHSYSNCGYDALGLVLERVCGRPYAALLQERVLAPLRMADTLPAVGERARDRLSPGHVLRNPLRGWAPDNPLVPAPWVPYEAADGCVCSTAEDMCRYARMLLARGRPLVSTESFGLMTEDTVDNGEGGRYGYGLVTTRAGGRELVGHGGGMVGHHAQLLCDRAAGLAAIALVDGDHGHRQLAEYGLALARAEQAGGPPPDPPALPEPSPPAARGAGDHPLAGLYRSHNPWLPAVRVAHTDGRLSLQVAGEETAELVPGQNGAFAVLLDGRPTPETVRFDLEVEGRPQRLWLNGADPCFRSPAGVD